MSEATPRPVALRLAEVAVGFGEARGLDAISLDVGRGERVAIVGASGAGKTTLLRAVAGLTPLRAGRVLIAPSAAAEENTLGTGAPAGDALRDVTALPPHRRDAVYLHQTPVPFPHLSVFENVAFPLRVRRVADAELRRRVGEALALVRLDGFGRRMPHTLSGGQRHRVALARAIVGRPALLLLDEPLSSLDPALRDEVREAVVRTQEQYGPALVLVTHDLDEAGLVAHRVGVLADRRLLQVAPPAELFARPASLAVARFLGVANEIPGRVDAGGCFSSALGRMPAARAGAPVAAGAAVAVVRPDGLRLVGASDGGGAAGRVVAVRHRARQTTVLVAVDGVPAPVEALVAPGASPAVGDGVRVAVEPNAAVVFAADG